ncbi:hypothetical protein Psi01_65780 [Planobispora siamensis]|uniref:Uncharacterized protein n=1 Tax=Planobispora siamensis TaxID=936338 RepID=A0A8J3SK94_9ACTN|nr:hypothetical protein Psi01_65780 [Planobispora siamensis]
MSGGRGYIDKITVNQQRQRDPNAVASVIERTTAITGGFVLTAHNRHGFGDRRLPPADGQGWAARRTPILEPSFRNLSSAFSGTFIHLSTGGIGSATQGL